MKTRIIACAIASLLLAGCAAFPAQSPYPSPGSLEPSTTVASQGSIFFVSATEAWELTQPPDQLRTVVLQTRDGGGRWKLWGIAPEPGSPVGFSATEVVLSTGTDLLRSSDGAHWSVRAMPTFGSPMFLPDLQHGWVGGIPVYFPAAPPAPTLPPGKGGGGGTTAKGGGGGTTGKGGGGGTTGKGGASAPASTCNDKGCSPIAIYSTSDGGATWRLLVRSIASSFSGPMYFFNPNVGVIEQNTTLLVTRDGGDSWHSQSFSIPGVSSDQPATDLAPTMFDARNGVLPMWASPSLYLSRTSDGGLTWSNPEQVIDCSRCTGQIALVDDQHWLDYSNGLNVTPVAGNAWTRATTTNPSATTTDVQIIHSPSATLIFAIAPGLFASETSDFGAHWRAVPLPDIYPTYRGFAGLGGWNGP